MEYLMTYGWAILIIAVVLATLFSLNVFNAGASLGIACIGTPGYSCSLPSITQNGQLTFTLGQGTGNTNYYAWFACASTANAIATTTPNNLQYGYIYANGQIQSAYYQGGNLALGSYVNSNNIVSSGTITISGLQCYPAAGGTTGMLSPIGSSFTGSIWMVFSAINGQWTPQFVKIATVSVKSSS
jgi:hypothetical protein